MLDPNLQKLLNEFANSQPALQIPDQPVASANPRLGDLLAAALISQEQVQTSVYTFKAPNGAIGTYALSPMVLPAGAIVTSVFTDVLTPLTSGGAATIALKTGTAGANTLVAAQAYTAITGTQLQTLAAPVKTATGGPLLWVIAGAALTGGVVSVSIKWIAPVIDLYAPAVPINFQDVPTNDLI